MHCDTNILRLCGGNKDAAELIRGAWHLCEVWDDAIDGDKRKPDMQIHNAFMFAIFGLHRNPVWIKHPELEAALRLTIANWIAANDLEKSRDREHLVTAYTLRCSPYDFFVAVVLAVCGHAAAIEAARYFRGADTPDRLDAYLREHLGE
jgi:hypothetical protein